MKNQWRILLFRAQQRTGIYASNHFSQPQFQVHLNSNLRLLRLFSSIPDSYAVPHKFPMPAPDLLNFLCPVKTTFRRVSYETAFKRIESRHVVFIANLCWKVSDYDEFWKKLELRNIAVNDDIVRKVLRKQYLDYESEDDSPKIAWQFFNWVWLNDRVRLSSKSYNMMLYILVAPFCLDEFECLVNSMNKRGIGILKGVYDKIETLDKERDSYEIEGMKASLASGCIDNSPDMCSRISEIVTHNVWNDEVEEKILNLNILFSSEMVTSIVGDLGTDPIKAMMFFRWLEKSGQFKHDGCTYNAMARVLTREDTIDRLWNLVHEMLDRGHEMQPDTYIKGLVLFCKWRMIEDAVDLYEIAMAGANKPSPHCFAFLLKKLVVSKQFDIILFSRAVNAFTGSGNAMASSTVDSVLKSLASVGRSGVYNMVFKVLEDAGVLAAGNIQSKIAYRLSASGNKEGASEFINMIEASGCNLDHKAWESLIDGHCVAGNLDEALHSFRSMIEKEGVTSAKHSFNLLMSAYCRRNRVIDACEILCQLVSEQQLEPLHSTYKYLIRKLLIQGGFTEAVNVLGLMTSHGFPPLIDPFIEHVSEYGTGAEAVLFIREITPNKFSSASVFLRMFDAFSKHGKQQEAHNLLSKCPDYVRNNAAVLKFFSSMKFKEGETSVTLAA